MPLRSTHTTERERLDAHEGRLAIYARDRGTCRSCGFPVTADEFQVAHRIADTLANRKRWGDAVIDDPRNKATTHAGRCNDAQNIGFNPVKARALADEIRGVQL